MLLNRKITFSTTIFFVLASNVSSWVVDDNGCRTPDRGVGNCVPAKFCKPIVNFLISTPRPYPSNVQQRIKSYICGYENKSYKVCCPAKPIPLIPQKHTYDQAAKDMGEVSRNLINRPNMKKLDEMMKALDDVKMIDNAEDSDISSHKNFNLLPQECGRVGLIDKISNGDNARLGQFPWMTLLSYKTDDGPKFWCGGTIINDRYILTAAHCITNLKNQLIGIRVGEHDTREKVDCELQEDNSKKCAPPVQDLPIEEVIPHPNFTSNNGFGDIGLLRVPPMNMSDYVKPICLPTGEFIENIPTRVTISGWGYTEGVLQTSPILQKASVPTISLDECQKFYKVRRVSISPKQVCLKGKKYQESCQGDSGGPLQSYGYIYDEIRCIQYGIISHGGKICGSGVVPEPHTRVGTYMKWILDNIKP